MILTKQKLFIHTFTNNVTREKLNKSELYPLQNTAPSKLKETYICFSYCKMQKFYFEPVNDFWENTEMGEKSPNFLGAMLLLSNELCFRD